MSRRIALVVLGLLSWLTGCGDKPVDAAAPVVQKTYPVRVASVRSGELHEGVAALGTVAWQRQVKVRSQAGGVVRETSPKEGERVRAGDVLTRIIAPELSARLDQIGAELRRAETERDFVCTNHDTDLRLQESGVLESARVDVSRKGCAAAREAVRALEARRSEANAGLARLAEKAPEAGVLLEWSVEPGEFVGPGQPLALLGAGKRLVVLSVPETDMRKGIAVGTEALIRVGNETLDSRVTFVSPLAKGPSRATRVEVAWPEAANALPAGTSVDVSLVLRRVKDNPIVPAAALFERDGAHFVMSVTDGRARAVEVSPAISAGGKVALDPSFVGDKVVVSRPGAVPEVVELFVVEAP